MSIFKKIFGDREDEFNTAIETDGCGDETPTWKKIMQKVSPC